MDLNPIYAVLRVHNFTAVFFMTADIVSTQYTFITHDGKTMVFGLLLHIKKYTILFIFILVCMPDLIQMNGNKINHIVLISYM